MLGIGIELLLSFLLLKYLAGKNLSVLGLWPSGPRFYQFLLGLALPVLFFFAFNFMVAHLVGNPYRAGGRAAWGDLLWALGNALRSVAYEDLLFRGALLWLLAWRLGAGRAVLVSSLAFGCYHWFAWNAFGSPVKMAVILLSTGSMGYVLALAFARTGSMYLGLGMHLGNNLCAMVIFGHGGRLPGPLLEKSLAVDPAVPGPWVSVPVIVLHYVGLQLLCYGLVRWFRCRAAGLPGKSS